MMKQFIFFWVRVIANAFRRWLAGHPFVFAAALAFFTVFSIAPVIIIAVAIMGLVLGQEMAQAYLIEQLNEVLGAQAAQTIQTAVASSQLDQSGKLPMLIGIAAMVFGATTVFAQLQLSLNAVWEVVPKPSRSSIMLYIKSRLLSLSVVLGIGFIMLVSLLLGTVLRAMILYSSTRLQSVSIIIVVLEFLLAPAVSFMFFTIVFRVLPDVILAWRDVFAGAIVTTLLFSVGRLLIGWYLTKTGMTSTYGAAGSLVVLLLWVNYSSLILLFGAAFTRAHFEARGLAICPRKSAVFMPRGQAAE